MCIRDRPSSNYKNILVQEFSKKVNISLENEGKNVIEKKKVKIVEEKQNDFELDKVTKSIIKTLIDNPEMAHLEELNVLIDSKEEFISKFINFLRSTEKPTFPMILHAFEMEKSFLINLNGQSLM